MEQRAQGWLGAECEVIHSPGSSCVFFAGKEWNTSPYYNYSWVTVCHVTAGNNRISCSSDPGLAACWG